MKHLLFDLDGTLTDPREGITTSYIHALRELGLVPPTAAELVHHIGPPTREVMSELLGTTDPGAVEEGVRLYRSRFATVGLYENTVYPGIAEVLAELRAGGHRLRVCTSKPEVYAVQILEHFRLAKYFEHIYGCELDGTRADKADLLAYLLERESIDPASAVLIGDRLHDVRAARMNQTRSIGVLWGFGSTEELTAAGADRLCPAVSALPDAIRDVFA